MEFDPFLISFEGLKLGEHDFKFLIDSTFFRELEYSEIQEGKVVIDALFIKSERLMEMELNFKGEVIVPCDLCGEDLVQTIDFEESLVIKTGVQQDEDEGIIIVDRDETKIDIGHYLYESISLSLPLKRVHEQVEGKPKCNETLLAKMNLNDNDNDDEVDPRWAALKKLK
ncbi:MAG: hypothetical protein CMP67_07835 [Flavobacteriales bacterium]|nr:hypothetical protein [Flavobacteriales bacterium]MBO72998.1 hypothetical protein [Flavobacteriales bacterium]|tara:strand:+ start:10 stop:519 length:510 start_codon:yes stop_codon:yes gene_type:complete